MILVLPKTTPYCCRVGNALLLAFGMSGLKAPTQENRENQFEQLSAEMFSNLSMYLNCEMEGLLLLIVSLLHLTGLCSLLTRLRTSQKSE